MRTESDLRETLRSLAGDPVDAEEMLDRLVTRAREPDVPRGRRGWRLPVLAGAVAASLLLGAIVIYRSVDRQGVSAPATAPAGTREVTFHGLAIDVPADWGTGEERCGTAIKNTVLLEAMDAACGVIHPPLVSSVRLLEYGDSMNNLMSGLTTTPVKIEGVAATKSTGVSGSFHVTIFDVPKAKADIVIRSPDATLGDRLGATLHFVSRDSNGCAVKAPDATQLVTGRHPSRAGSDQAMIPPGATSLIACRYQATLLEQGAVIQGSDAASFTRAINAIPEGFSRAPTDTYTADSCRPSGSDPGSLIGVDAYDSESYLVTAQYPAGPPVTVIIKLGLCGKLGAANGTRSAQRTQALIDLIGSAGIGPNQGLPDAVSATH